MDASLNSEAAAELTEILDTVLASGIKANVNVVVHVNMSATAPPSLYPGSRTTGLSPTTGGEELWGGAEVPVGKWFDGITGKPVEKPPEDISIESDPTVKATSGYLEPTSTKFPRPSPSPGLLPRSDDLIADIPTERILTSGTGVPDGGS